MIKYILYKITSPDDNIYYGITKMKLSARLAKHKNDWKHGHTSKLYKSFTTHGYDAHLIETDMIAHVKDKTTIEILEQIKIWSVPKDKQLNTYRAHNKKNKIDWCKAINASA